MTLNDPVDLDQTADNNQLGGLDQLIRRSCLQDPTQFVNLRRAPIVITSPVVQLFATVQLQ